MAERVKLMSHGGRKEGGGRLRGRETGRKLRVSFKGKFDFVTPSTSDTVTYVFEAESEPWMQSFLGNSGSETYRRGLRQTA